MKLYQPQNNNLATLAPRLKKEEGEIDWSKSAVEIVRQVRALHPWPGTFTQGPSGLLKILELELADIIEDYKPGIVFKQRQNVYVATGQGTIMLLTVQPAGKKAMTAVAWLNGQPDLEGARLGKA